MAEAEVIRYLIEELDHVGVARNSGDSFFFYDPDGDPADRMIPFATITTGDHYDDASDLDEPGAYRLNIGLTKATYTAMFGSPPRQRADGGVLDTGFDHRVRDRLMPHPVYASQYWVCVVSPRDETFEAVRPLLAEAHAFAARKVANRSRRTSEQRQPGDSPTM